MGNTRKQQEKGKEKLNSKDCEKRDFLQGFQLQIIVFGFAFIIRSLVGLWVLVEDANRMYVTMPEGGYSYPADRAWQVMALALTAAYAVFSLVFFGIKARKTKYGEGGFIGTLVMLVVYAALFYAGTMVSGRVL